jgi:hypothetical protein
LSIGISLGSAVFYTIGPCPNNTITLSLRLLKILPLFSKKNAGFLAEGTLRHFWSAERGIAMNKAKSSDQLRF